MTLFAQWYQQFASASQDGSSTMFIWLNYGEKRADERTRIGLGLLGVAGVCKSLLCKSVSFHCFALCCTVLRSQLCQSDVN